ncbi:hypothetical protein KX935_00720 [Streptobacillus moniliformis]|uniref:Uncharacterized protein n=1 Tax=Streptobacillus moniliformis (strain ATCC 14647 / DSM 12112 / NCTC 10651 / 9901) TaxID=519441 RepID=D1AXL9_STRM9|nr:hypothetical protein [Streptobacillus moniliformis]ACZ01045.1 hypothetical protein Smon_0566 [Streptobacillus moniliformis DSM 12112]AVL42586.1 hypothetical protein CEP89_01345 [Streptobacillus moniliformis]QXW65823.1 hypothetical protein KX935_00720 [Streptobacillus moniliformis]SQA13815.1 Uncharacterised protein [Streptobacillus moniliformis]
MYLNKDEKEMLDEILKNILVFIIFVIAVICLFFCHPVTTISIIFIYSVLFSINLFSKIVVF